jgi:hypothetical protein
MACASETSDLGRHRAPHQRDRGNGEEYCEERGHEQRVLDLLCLWRVLLPGLRAAESGLRLFAGALSLLERVRPPQ